MWAIIHAQRVLHWQENLTSEDMPPEWMWPLPDDIEEWFERVDQKFRERYGKNSGNEEPELVQNELTRGRR